MHSDQLRRLRTHGEQLALSLVREANPDGIIRTPNADGTAGPDLPATHHLIEVMAHLDGGMFADGMATALGWLMNPENGASSHPFTLDSLALVGTREETEAALRAGVADHQLKDGSIPIFTAYLPGGDYFSTLWGTKILLRYSQSAFRTEIELALGYLVDRREIGCTRASQLGFLGLLLAKARPGGKEMLLEIGEKCRAYLDRHEDDAGLLIDRLFVLEDLLAIDTVVGGFLPHIDRHLASIFALDEEAVDIPAPIAATRHAYSDSLFLETLARCAIVVILRCASDGQTDLALTVNRLVHNDYRNTRYKALQTTAAFRAFLERYGSIHEAFSAYNDDLEEAWKQHTFDKTVFLMMPFRRDLKFRKLTEVIKDACAARGYAAIRVDEATRRFSDRLWDNLVVNMLSAKQAIAVYVSEPVVDRLKSDEVRLFANPNVALEFGFFKARGQDVLLLKDKSSELPSDLQGFLWSEFDIENPDTTVPPPLHAWLDRLAAPPAAG